MGPGAGGPIHRHWGPESAAEYVAASKLWSVSRDLDREGAPLSSLITKLSCTMPVHALTDRQNLWLMPKTMGALLQKHRRGLCRECLIVLSRTPRVVAEAALTEAARSGYVAREVGPCPGCLLPASVFRFTRRDEGRAHWKAETIRSEPRLNDATDRDTEVR